ncbi:MAG: hypothetical protein AAFU68_02915 [Pseudomonadota bacterium]
MRTPTPPEKAFAWWRDAIAGNAPPVHDDAPQCGFFKRRADKNSRRFIPARIDLLQPIEDGALVADESLVCIVGDQYRDPYAEWLWLAKHPISRREYEKLLTPEAPVSVVEISTDW